MDVILTKDQLSKAEFTAQGVSKPVRIKGILVNRDQNSKLHWPWDSSLKVQYKNLIPIMFETKGLLKELSHSCGVSEVLNDLGSTVLTRVICH